MSEWIAFSEREPKDGQKINTADWDIERQELRDEIPGIYAEKSKSVESKNREFYYFTHWQSIPTHIDLEGEEE